MGPIKLQSSPPPPPPLLEAIKELTKGRGSADRLRAMLQGDRPVDVAAARVLADQIFGTFARALSTLDSGVKAESSNDSAILQGEEAATKRRTQSASRGGYRKRAYPYEIKRMTSDKVDDGRSWRKYGQKEIYNSKFPRSYFRCTHKHDQGCPATRQVQRSEDDPSLYEITYIGNHTCKDPSEIATPSNISRDSRNMISFAADRLQEADQATLGSSSSACFVLPALGTECEHGDVMSGFQPPGDLDMEGLMGESFDQFDELLFTSFLKEGLFKDLLL